MHLRLLFVLGIVSIFLLIARAECADALLPVSDLRTEAGSGVQYYLSLPKGWDPKSTWPILVAIDGGGHNFPACFGSFVNARGARPFIVVVPCVTSNGNDPGELKGVLAIVQEVQKSSHGQPKFFITGCSAGGHLAWQLILLHPELLAGAAPAAGNFRFRGIDAVSKAPERIKLPIHAFQGDKDGIKPALDAQWADALKLAHENGFENLTRTEVPGAGHQAFPSQVVQFFESLLPK
jgi:pimeloyl-ACP methyl ester carboxylesterase